MSTNQIIMVVFTSTLAIFFLLAFVWSTTKSLHKSKLEKFKQAVRQKILQIPIIGWKNDLRRINVIANNNPVFKDEYKRITKLYDTLIDHYTRINQKAMAFLATLPQSSKTSRDNFLLSLTADIGVLNKVQISFENNGEKFVKADEFLKAEMAFYTKKMRFINKKFLFNKTQIPEVIGLLEAKNKEIQTIYNLFETNFRAGRSFECAENIKVYREKIIIFATLIDEAPVLGHYVFTRLPQEIQGLKTVVAKSTAEQKKMLAQLGIRNVLQKVEKGYADLKKDYCELNFTNCKNGVRTILHDVLEFKHLFTKELTAASLLKEQKDVATETNRFFADYKTLRQKFKKAQFENAVTEDTAKIYAATVNSARCFYELITSWQHNTQNDLSTVRVAKLAQVYKEQLTLAAKMSKLLDALRTTSNFQANFRSQTNHLSLLVNQLRAEITQQNIVLTPGEVNGLNVISKSTSSLEKQTASSNLNPSDLESAFAKLNAQTLWVYKNVAYKAQLASVVRNLFDYTAPYRALSPRLNEAVLQAEQKYLSGEYQSAIHHILYSNVRINEDV